MTASVSTLSAPFVFSSPFPSCAATRVGPPLSSRTLGREFEQLGHLVTYVFLEDLVGEGRISTGRLAGSADLRQRVGQAAQQTMTRYTWERSALMLENLLRHVIASAGQTSA